MSPDHTDFCSTNISLPDTLNTETDTFLGLSSFMLMKNCPSEGFGAMRNCDITLRKKIREIEI
jgi:hypothetical protein